MNKQKGYSEELFGFPFEPQPQEDCATKGYVDGIVARKVNKQEEIREGIRHLLLEGVSFIQNVDELDNTPDKPQQILNYLHSQGVAIKVDKELPEIPLSLRDFDGYERCKEDMLRAGYVATESLVKEG